SYSSSRRPSAVTFGGLPRALIGNLLRHLTSACASTVQSPTLLVLNGQKYAQRGEAVVDARKTHVLKMRILESYMAECDNCHAECGTDLKFSLSHYRTDWEDMKTGRQLVSPSLYCQLMKRCTQLLPR